MRSSVNAYWAPSLDSFLQLKGESCDSSSSVVQTAVQSRILPTVVSFVTELASQRVY